MMEDTDHSSEAHNSLIDITKRLEVAINNSYVDEAGKLAQILAQAQAPLRLRNLTGIESEIKVSVTIENQQMTIMALPSSSIYSLKMQLWHLFKVLPEEQRLIISNKLAKNNDLLSDFLSNSGDVLNVSVYIMSKIHQ